MKAEGEVTGGYDIITMIHDNIHEVLPLAWVIIATVIKYTVNTFLNFWGLFLALVLF